MPATYGMPDYVSPPLVLPPYNPINPYYDMLTYSSPPNFPLAGPMPGMPGMPPPMPMMAPPMMRPVEGHGHHGAPHGEPHGEGERYSMTAFWQHHPLLQWVTIAFAAVGAWKLGLNRLVKDGAHRISDRTR